MSKKHTANVLSENMSIQQTMQACPICGLIVLVRIYHSAHAEHAAYWEDLCGGPVSPLTGMPHVCIGLSE